MASAIILSSGYIAYRKYVEKPPNKWRKVGEISELICYPIKSCAPVRTTYVNCAILGIANNFLRDRVFMITKLDGNFITARAYPLLVKIQPIIQEDKMILSAPNMPDIELDFSSLKIKPIIKNVVWGEAVDTVDCGDDIAKWLSTFLFQEETGLRLVYFPFNKPPRQVREKNRGFKNMVQKDTGALHDASSYMLINLSSIDDLNTKLDEKVTAVRFRPNFVVNGPKAYEEDSWSWIKIGDDTIFRNVKPCTRYIILFFWYISI